MFKVKRHDPKPLYWWYSQREEIDTKPKYQRRSNLWDDRKQAFLIDSILNDYDMPKFYLADFTSVNTDLNKNKTLYAVIDGKQRLQAIFRFFKGELSLWREFKYLPNPSLELGGATFTDLKRYHPEVAEKVENYIPSVMSVITDEKIKIEQLFVRLNSGTQVNRAERRNAMDGIIPDIIRDLVEHSFFISNIRFNTLRMSDHNTAAKILLIEHRGKFVDTSANTLDGLVIEAIDGVDSPYLKSESRVIKVLNDMSKVFKKKDALLSSTGPIPVYYWFVKHSLGNRKYIRQFLEEFTLKVKENQIIVSKNPDAGDPLLSYYYTMMRTTNEARSLQARYEILMKSFAEFIKKRNKSSHN
jgi:hypothetical protein